MPGARKNKTQRNRISHSTRAIFYENVKRGMAAKLDSEVQAEQIRWLMKHAHMSRTHAQRLLNSPHQEPEKDQGCSIDTLAFIAQAFDVTASELLTVGCKFSKERSDIRSIRTHAQDGVHPAHGRIASKARAS